MKDGGFFVKRGVIFLVIVLFKSNFEDLLKRVVDKYNCFNNNLIFFMFLFLYRLLYYDKFEVKIFLGSDEKFVL